MSKCLLPLFTLMMMAGGALVQTSSGEITDAAWELRFTPPEGWVQHQAPTGYLFVAPDQQGLLAILPHETRTVEARPQCQ